MKLLSRGLLAAALVLFPLPSLAASVPAIVKSAVNIRTAPSSSNSRVVGALKAGDRVTVSCSKGWCRLSDGRGYVATKFLRLNAGSGGAAEPKPVVEEPAVAETTPVAETTVEQPAAAMEAVAAPQGDGLFNGAWNVNTDAGANAVPLTIAQMGTEAEGRMVIGDITTTMTGNVDGTRFIFNWENSQGGKVVIAGDGFLNLAGDGALSGVLMHNGSVVSAMQARR